MARDRVDTKKLNDDLVQEIAKSSDPNTKVVLLLMLRLLEAFVDRVDEILDDERGLREAVLNGHEPVHHDHHEWIAEKMQAEKEAAIAAAEEAKEERQGWRAIRFSVIERVLTTGALVVMGLYGWIGK